MGRFVLGSSLDYSLRAQILQLLAMTALLLAASVPAHAQGAKIFRWTNPTTNSNGTTLNDLAGIEISYGTSSTTYSTTTPLGVVTSTTVNFPTNGTYYVAVRAFDASGNRSSYSNQISITISSTPADSDGDGTTDANDCAPSDNTRWRTGSFYLDSDTDGVRNTMAAQSVCHGTSTPPGFTTATSGLDNCPTVSNASQLNTDGDSQGDACDTNDDNDSVLDTADCAPTNASLWRNQAYADADADGVRNSTTLSTSACFGATAPAGFTLATNGPDNCPTVSNTNQADSDKDGTGDACENLPADTDADGIPNTQDNCPTVSNANQLNTDDDSQGDACDTDDDNDATLDTADCAPTIAALWRNQAYPDPDSDGVRNVLNLLPVACFGATAPALTTLATNGPDNCPAVSNPAQTDTDGDGLGDACDTSTPPPADADLDGIPNAQDNCPNTSNSDQADTDADGTGDACDTPTQGTRAQCSITDDGLSAVAMQTRRSFILASLDGQSSAQGEIARGSQILVGNFGATLGPSGLGGLELATTKVENRKNLRWTISSSGEPTSFLFGKSSQDAFGCHADADGILDALVADSRGFVTGRTGAAPITGNFRGFGTIRSLDCSDADGDGIDELYVVHTRLPRGAAKPTDRSAFLSIFSLQTGLRGTTIPLPLKTAWSFVLDSDADGTREVCYSVPASRTSTDLICRTADGETKMTVAPLLDLTVGSYEKNPAGNPVQGLLLLGKDRKLSRVLFGGTPTPVVIPGVSSGAGVVSRGTSFLRCR